MEELIPVASKLQDVLGALGQNTNLDLPQIVVVGGQSSGKSSVLESIVGRSFLPRGHGIVTRRPLVLQLYNTSGPDPLAAASTSDSANDSNTDDNIDGNTNDDIGGEIGGGKTGGGKIGGGKIGGGNGGGGNDEKKSGFRLYSTKKGQEESDEWGEFLHQPGKRYFNFKSIRSEIERDTERLTGIKSKGVSPTPIHLKIYSPRVLALTLVDLPGLTKVAVADQPMDIEERIRDINVQYASNPNAIILAVTSANTDLASSDALKLARELDPAGDRTIGVLTKCDLMDPGTDAADVLHNKVIPLRRGYVAVVNRGQRDVDADVSIREGLRNEDRFFRSHPSYSRDRALVAKCGTANLARSLNGILIHHIRECLPELKLRIGNMMADVQGELEALGLPEEQGGNLGGRLLGLLSKFSANFASMIDGKASNTNQHHDGMPTDHTPYHNASSLQNAAIGSSAEELYGGARISYIFHDVFSRSLNGVGAFDGLSEDEIRTTICNANGTRPALFVPEISFDILVRRQIRRLEQPGVQCVELVYDELQRIANQAEPTELTRYPNLRERMIEVVGALLKRSVAPTQMWVSNLVRIELSYINTNHPDFIGGSKAVAKLMEKMAKEKEAAASRALNRHTIEKEGGVTKTPRRSMSDAGGATPLSSSSLEKYMAADDGYHNKPNGAPPQHVVVDHRPTNNESGGIMNFIFRGSTTAPTNTTTTTTNTPSKPQWSSAPKKYPPPYPPSIVQLPQVPDTMRQTDAPPTDREKVETEIIKSLIESYFSIVRKNYIDMVPKTIMYFLVNHVKDTMQNELVGELYREAEVSSLMKEAEDIAQRRRTCVEMRDLLRKALEIVNEVRDFNTFK